MERKAPCIIRGQFVAKHTATWKSTERAVARRLGGRRVGPSGTSTADVVTERLAVECKHRASLPEWLTGAMSQAVGAAGSGQVPVVVLHEAGQRRDNDLVIVRMKDFQQLFGQIGGDKENKNDTSE